MLSILGNLLRDRFVIFIALGACLFALNAYLEHNARQIRVTSSDVEMLKGRWEAQMGTPPTPEELTGLVDYHVREEILVQEARRLGLDRDDVILRRRLEQKMELLIKDRYQPSDPDDEQLVTFYENNKESYHTQKRVGFRHVFLGPARETDADEIERALQDLSDEANTDAWRSFGKPFMLARQYGPRSQNELTELFGSAFATQLMLETAPGGWRGPIESSYGLHLVQTLAVEPPRLPPFEELRELVAADFREAETKEHEAEAWRELRDSYRVKIDAPAP